MKKKLSATKVPFFFLALVKVCCIGPTRTIKKGGAVALSPKKNCPLTVSKFLYRGFRFRLRNGNTVVAVARWVGF